MKGTSDHHIPLDIGTEKLEELLNKICDYNLAHKVSSYHEEVYVSIEHCQSYLFNNTDVQIRPWLDYKGELNLDMVRRLQERVLTVVMRFPGARESFLINQLGFLNVQSAKIFLDIMVEQELIFVEEVAERVINKVPSIFDDSNDGKLEVIFIRFYFLNLNKCYEKPLPVIDKIKKIN